MAPEWRYFITIQTSIRKGLTANGLYWEIYIHYPLRPEIAEADTG